MNLQLGPQEKADQRLVSHLSACFVPKSRPDHSLRALLTLWSSSSWRQEPRLETPHWGEGGYQIAEREAWNPATIRSVKFQSMIAWPWGTTVTQSGAFNKHWGLSHKAVRSTKIGKGNAAGASAQRNGTGTRQNSERYLSHELSGTFAADKFAGSAGTFFNEIHLLLFLLSRNLAHFRVQHQGRYLQACEKQKYL